MTGAASAVAHATIFPALDLLRCPETGRPLEQVDGGLASAGGPVYALTASGIPLFAPRPARDESRKQQAHYDAVATAYEANLAYPHTRAYFEYLDRRLREACGGAGLGTIAEVCCGLGEAMKLFSGSFDRAVGVDISSSMLERAARERAGRAVSFVQGDATRLPLADATFDTVFMLGGIHHVNDRARLFSEVSRVLKPGGRFIFREPVSDFFPWRMLRAVVYRLSPMLDHLTERPLTFDGTVPLLGPAGLRLRHWSTHGFIGFCVFMNSDVLVVNRVFRLVPGIEALTRFSARIDDWILRWPSMRRRGLQVIGVAEKPA